MPAQILHSLFGEDVIAEIFSRIHPRFGGAAEKAMEKIRGEYKAAFALGCQGPDIFYHSQMRRPVALEYGALLHRRGYGVFTAALLKMGLPDPPPGEGPGVAAAAGDGPGLPSGALVLELPRTD
jgi:hypothetical protein